jgi:hypothetical protein
MEIVANVAKNLTGLVITSADLTRKTSGTIYAIIRLEDDGDASDGYFLNASNAWVSSVSNATAPQATHIAGGLWLYALPAAATTGRGGASIIVDFTDDHDTPASATVLGTQSEYTVYVEDRVIGSDVGLSAGAQSVTIDLEETDTTPITGAQIAIYDSNNTTKITVVSDDDNDGTLSASLNDGTYKLRIFRSGYSFTSPETLTVSGDGSHTINGTQVVTGTPSSPSGCVVFCDLQDAGIVDHQSVTLQATYITPQANGDVIGTSRTVSATSNASGRVELELAQGAVVDLEIENAGVDIRLLIPAQASYNLTSVIAELSA